MTGRLWPYVLLAVLCGALFFWRLGAVPLMGLDEGLYSECSREMLASGDYVVPTCNGGQFFDKPPIAYWLQTASMRAFGVNSFAARLPSAIEQFLLVGLTVLLGTRIFSRRVGLMAGFALACSILGAGLARIAILDAAFTLAITASLGAFLLAYTGVWPQRGYLLFWAAMSVSVMVKGPAGAVLILATVMTFLLIRRDLRAMLRAMPAAGLLVFALVAAPWYVLVQIRTDGAFLREFLVHQNIQRALGKDFQHNLPFYSYLPIFLLGFFPWSVFLPAALVQSRKHVLRQAHDAQLPKRDSGVSLFLAVWIGVIFVVFSVFKSKLPAYIFPIYPPSALLVGLLWSRAAETHELTSLKRATRAATLTACAMGAAMLIVPSHLDEPIPGLSAALLPMGLSLVLGCAGCYLMLLLKRPMHAFAALCCAMAVFVGAAVSLGLPIAARTNAVPAVRIARSVARRDGPVFAYKLSPPVPQLGFYARRPVVRVEDPSSLELSETFWVVAQTDRLMELPPGGRVQSSAGPYVLYRFN